MKYKLLFLILIISGNIVNAASPGRQELLMNDYTESKTEFHSFPDLKRDYIKGVGTLNLRFKDKHLFVEYNNLFLYVNRCVHDFYINEEQHVDLWWYSWPDIYVNSYQEPTLFDISFNVDFSGSVIHTVVVYPETTTRTMSESNPPLIIYPYEGMDLTFGMDRARQGAIIATDWTYLYGFVRNGKLTGDFATQQVSDSFRTPYGKNITRYIIAEQTNTTGKMQRK